MGQGLVVDLDRPVLDPESVGDGLPGLGGVGQHPDAIVLITELQLGHRTDHSLGLDAADP